MSTIANSIFSPELAARFRQAGDDLPGEAVGADPDAALRTG